MDNIEVVTCSIVRDLPITSLALDWVKKHLKVGAISVVMPPEAFPEGRRQLGSEVEILDERELSGGLSLRDLQRMTHIHDFPERAGWYMQQLVKLGFALMHNSDDYYLIWDSDTIPLRPTEFFSADGRPFYTLAEERHNPYFQTYRRLLGTPPQWQGSFISQHMIIKRSIAWEMLGEVVRRHPSSGSWSSAIMDSLAPVKSTALFSEYETYGNFVYSRYPDQVVFRRLPWLRGGSGHCGTRTPSGQQLETLAQDYVFAAFEDLRPTAPAWQQLLWFAKGAAQKHCGGMALDIRKHIHKYYLTR